MTRQRIHDDPYDSRVIDDLYDTDASFSAVGDADADDFLDVYEDVSSPESDVMDVEDFSDDDSNVADQVYLFAGNVHLLEYYQKALREFKESAFNVGDYSPGSTIQLNSIKKQWRTFCTDVVGRDPQTCLESIDIRLLYNFFDWSLNQIVTDVSEALCNLTLDHTNSTPFQKHYLSHAVCADLWEILCGQKPQQALLKQSCSVGHSMSQRRPVDLTPKQAVYVNTDPNVTRLTRQLKNLRLGTKQQIDAQRELRNLKQRLKRLLLKKIREDWTDEQAIDDIEHQLQGVAFTKPVPADITYCPQLPAQKRLVKALTAPVDPTLEGQYRRRDDAINVIITYCSVEEGRTSRRKFTSPTKEAQSKPTHGPPEDNPLSIARLSVFVRNDRERPKRCFLCIGAALSLEPDDPRAEALMYEFYTPRDLTKHFKRKHLSLLAQDSKPEYKVCDFTLSSKMHLQNHALRVHGTVS
ncbi:Uu.00g091080.m01.CDS01 [Anthostomella pinea]|uniref:Uu.00g091080.m01.CDS01 n=1 Tax=Anthostomella pinea TaxID=933095 RepID=A0AAI8YKD0_9PEZI|nr:Uu.00g091080.m01.CDS01 [Anthostomella pinea]